MSGHDYPQASSYEHKTHSVDLGFELVILSPRRVGRLTRRHSYRAWLALGKGC